MGGGGGQKRATKPVVIVDVFLLCCRYIAVCHAFKYQQIYTLSFARNVVCGICGFTLLISCPNFAARSISQHTIALTRKVYQGMRSALVVIVCTVMFVMYSRLPLLLSLLLLLCSNMIDLKRKNC